MPRNATDLILKYLVGAFQDAALEWLGVRDTHIVRAYPTEIAHVEIRQNFMDTVFETARGEILHFEFQTTKESNLYRFLLYDAHIAAQYRKPVQTIVLYVRDVHHAKDRIDAGGLQYQVENVYLKIRDAYATLDRIERRIHAGAWQPSDRFDLAFAPHMSHPGQSIEDVLRRTVELALSIPDADERSFMAALLIGLSGKFVDESEMARLEEALQLNDLLKSLFEDIASKVEQEAEARGEAIGEARGEVIGEARGEVIGKIEVAKRMIRMGFDRSVVLEATGLSHSQLEELQKNVH